MSFTAMLPLLAKGAEMLGGWVKGKTQQTADITKAVATRAGSAPDWVLGIVFTVWAAPFVHVYVDPEQAGRLAAAFASMPGWYVETFQDISYGVAGVAALLKMARGRG